MIGLVVRPRFHRFYSLKQFRHKPLALRRIKIYPSHPRPALLARQASHIKRLRVLSEFTRGSRVRYETWTRLLEDSMPGHCEAQGALDVYFGDVALAS